MNIKKQFSDFMALNGYDLLKGFVIAVLTSVLTAIAGTLEKGSLPSLSEFKAVAIVGFAAGVSYLLKNFFTNSQGSLGTQEKAAPPVVPLTNSDNTPSA